MTSGPRSGKFGVIHGASLGETPGNPAAIERVFNWQFNDLMSPEVRYHSASAFGPDLESGIEDWNASFSIYDGFSPLCLPGNIFEIEMYGVPDNNVYGSLGDIRYGRCIVDSITINHVYQPSQSLTMLVNVSGVGCTDVKKGVIVDATINPPSQMCSLRIERSINGTDWFNWDNVVQSILTMTSVNPPFVNSSTYCGTGRRAGNINWTLAVTEQESQPNVKGSRAQFRIYNNASLFWFLKWGMYLADTNIVSDRDTAQILNKVANVSMEGRDDQGELGEIRLPDTGPPGTIFWPPVPASAPTFRVTDLAAAGAAGAINLSWTPTSGDPSAPTWERVYRSIAGPCGPFMFVVEQPISGAYNDTTVPTGATYHYYVTSGNPLGESGKSNIVSATAS